MRETVDGQVAKGDEAAPMATLQVELVGDLICPFTYLGKRRLDKAVSYVHGPLSLGWYPFQLNPGMPEQGESFDSYMASRFGSVAAVQPVLDRLRAEGRDVDLEFRFDRLTHVPNTLPVHQLVQHAADRDMDVLSLVESFMASYLTDGEDIGDRDVIIDIAEGHGLSRAETVRVLDDSQLRQTVVGMEEQIRDSGITGVPGFLMNRRLLLVGVQEVPGIIEGFDRAMFGDAEGQPVAAPLH